METLTIPVPHGVGKTERRSCHSVPVLREFAVYPKGPKRSVKYSLDRDRSRGSCQTAQPRAFVQ